MGGSEETISIDKYKIPRQDRQNCSNGDKKLRKSKDETLRIIRAKHDGKNRMVPPELELLDASEKTGINSTESMSFEVGASAALANKVPSISSHDIFPGTFQSKD
ncbi:predicted protein [Botrytis cinerea T4]|uniref:Uncharacterized protein n=1 Tax=Botryotinia fuckeliana (strain T4) TaxID=999810 RepID=G2YDS0_BOTF4|nr:predicted protein [Botrytis cinerea T4]